MEETRSLLREAESPEGILQLWERHIEGQMQYELVVNGVFIMASYNALSSELLVRRAVERARPQSGRLLIGGLGLGYSVREACRHRSLEAIHVVELNPQIIQWNRSLLRDLNGVCLSDRRVRAIPGDFLGYVAETRERYHMICMDIDNGPMMLASARNAEAYSVPFYRRVAEILLDRGVFVIWSCNPEPALEREMETVFSRVWMEEVAEFHDGRQVPYYLYFGQK